VKVVFPKRPPGTASKQLSGKLTAKSASMLFGGHQGEEKWASKLGINQKEVEQFHSPKAYQVLGPFAKTGAVERHETPRLSQWDADAPAGLRSVKEGFLMKRGGRRRAYQKRYFILSFHKLSYYKEPTDAHARGCIPLHHYTTIDNTGGKEGDKFDADSPYPFTITPHQGGRTFVLCAKTEPERNSWVTTIEGLIQEMKMKPEGQRSLSSPGSRPTSPAGSPNNSDDDEDEADQISIIEDVHSTTKTSASTNPSSSSSPVNVTTAHSSGSLRAKKAAQPSFDQVVNDVFGY